MCQTDCFCSAPVLGPFGGHLACQPSSTIIVKLPHCAAGAAMSLFESLELWDALILCYRMLQKVPQAKALVLARLQVSLHVVKEWLMFTWAAPGRLLLDTDLLLLESRRVVQLSQTLRVVDLALVHLGGTWYVP